jgi:hypothetical protein
MTKAEYQLLLKENNSDTPEISLPARSQNEELYAQVIAPIKYSGPATSTGATPQSVKIKKPGASSTVTFTTYDFTDFFGDGREITPSIIQKILQYDRTRTGKLVGLDQEDLQQYGRWLETEQFRYNCFGFAIGSQIGDGKTPIGWLQQDKSRSLSLALGAEFYPAYRHSIQRNANYNLWLDNMFRENKIKEGDLILFREDRGPIHAAVAVKDNGVAYLLHKPGQQPLMRTSMETAIKHQYPKTTDIVIYRPR